MSITSSTWWSITQELAAMLCWAAARASACFKPPCCFRSHPPSKPSNVGGLFSIRFSRKGAQWCQALARLDCLGYRAAPDVVSFNCGISACGQVGFKSSPSKQIIAIWIFGIIYGWSPTWCSNITKVTTRTWIITGIQLEEFIVNNYSLSRRSNPVTSSRKNLDEFHLISLMGHWWPTTKDRPAAGSIPWIFFNNLEAWVIEAEGTDIAIFLETASPFWICLIHAEAKKNILSQQPKDLNPAWHAGSHQDLHQSPGSQDEISSTAAISLLVWGFRIALLVYCAWSPTIIYHQPNRATID